jgi:hypothetical protein
VEQQQDEAIRAAHEGRAQASVKSSMDMHTEVLPLVELGANASPQQKESIKYTMWYI